MTCEHRQKWHPRRSLTLPKTQNLGDAQAVPDIFRLVAEPVAQRVAVQDQLSQLPAFELVQLLHSADLIPAEVEGGDVGGPADYVLHGAQGQHAVVAQV